VDDTGSDFERTLNPAQLKAVEHGEGPLLIVAGAGTGKTRTLVCRLAKLVRSGVDPEEILLLTFTRKAAREMLERAEKLVGQGSGRRAAGGTFHSFANYVIRPYARLLGYPPSFGIMDQADAVHLIGKIAADLKGAGENRFPKNPAVLNVISLAANLGADVPYAIEKSFAHLRRFKSEISRIALVYREEKKASALMDFDDLLVNLLRLMTDFADARRSIASRWRHVLVDEYQDTNPLQASLTSLLASVHGNVTAVGDEAQSIYAFRGADVKNIMQFPKLFRGAKILKLEENYRSVGPILVVANSVLAGASHNYGKVLTAARGAGALPVLSVCADVYAEAEWAADRIKELTKKKVPLKDIAVLFRASAHSFELERRLQRDGVPFTKYGGLKFMEAAHNKDFASFLRVAANPQDSVSLARILRQVRGTGPAGAQKIIDWAEGSREKIAHLSPSLFSPQGVPRAMKLIALLSKIMGEDDDIHFRVPLIREYYLELVPELYPEDYPGRVADIEELAMAAGREKSLSDFLAELTLDPPGTASLRDSKAPPEDLTLSTVHSAKGLEWKHVFILSLTDGRFPLVYGTKTQSELEEELRLLYVAITRARDELYLMFPEVVATYGGTLNEPCRFLKNIPDGHLEICRGSRLLKHSAVFGRERGGGGDDSDFCQEMAAPAPRRSYRSHLPEKSGGRDKNDPGMDVPGSAVRSRISAPVRGQIVEHMTFGRGRVTRVAGSVATINFDSYGSKRVNFVHGTLFSAD
jgi:DNA helicase-2/ATP-dependent DNA helicase PcrA